MIIIEKLIPQTLTGFNPEKLPPGYAEVVQFVRLPAIDNGLANIAAATLTPGEEFPPTLVDETQQSGPESAVEAPDINMPVRVGAEVVDMTIKRERKAAEADQQARTIATANASVAEALAETEATIWARDQDLERTGTE